MSNPYLPKWEYIPDGEPRVFGNRVYVYGSHDAAASDKFCDKKLKVWSAPIDNLNEWTCHGVSFQTIDEGGRTSDAKWAYGNDLYAPDVVEKDGKYYLYAYIMDAKGCVGVSDKPEGPFTMVSKYKYKVPENNQKAYNEGWFIDPGVLVDEDGRVYIYCGYEKSFVAEINAENMYEVVEGTYQEDIIPIEEPFAFFEACSPRKAGDTYYLIYSPRRGSQLVYATSKSPMGPFTYQGTIIDNGVDYPGGNNHGSICNINGQWYIFYHRMTNGTIMSRRGCVERIEMLPDGSIPQVEMTSLGFEEYLNPFQITDAEIACVLKGGCMVIEKNVMNRVVSNITTGCVAGFKYFEFGEDESDSMTLHIKVNGFGCKGNIHIKLDSEDGEEIGCISFGTDSGILTDKVKNVHGRHAIYFVIEDSFSGYFKDMFKDRQLLELDSFVFLR